MSECLKYFVNIPEIFRIDISISMLNRLSHGILKMSVISFYGFVAYGYFMADVEIIFENRKQDVE